MKRAGRQCNVLNINPRAPKSNEYIRISGAGGLLKELVRHAYDDWLLNVHTNGQNPKSWLIALVCGLIAQAGPGATLTLHSGGVPQYLREGSDSTRAVARLTCLLYDRVICVNEEIAETLTWLGIPKQQLEITPAFFPVERSAVILPSAVEDWLRNHSPVICSTMFFRPEYGFEVLVDAVETLRAKYPNLGCAVMGSGDAAGAEALIRQKALHETVFLTGDLDHELCLELMSRSSLFVRPTFMDGDSISVREAMSLGVPVVASNVGTRPDGVWMFQPGDVPDLCKQIVRALQERAVA
jgi:glycogen synthase